jgi:hypothetical protein
MTGDIIPIEQLLAAVREGGELFDGSVNVDELGEQAGGTYRVPVDDPVELADGEEAAEDENAHSEQEDDDALLYEDDLDAESEEGATQLSVRQPRSSTGPFPPQHVYGEGLAFAAAMARLEEYLRKIAFRIAAGDAEFADDLVQEARIELWEIDASRFDEADQMYLKRALVTRMIRSAERELVKGTGVPRAKLRQRLRGSSSGRSAVRADREQQRPVLA